MSALTYVVDFFNSTFFVGIVGASAILLYVWQKKDIKRDAARTILQEIKYAEQQIRNFRTLRNYSFADQLLPTNSWNKNVHLFIKDLIDPELDMISRFYANAEYLDKVIGKISDDTHNAQLFPFIPQLPSNSVPGVQGTPNIQPPFQPIRLDIKEVESNSHKILKEVSNNIELVGSTPASDKLRKIATKKILFVF